MPLWPVYFWHLFIFIAKSLLWIYLILPPQPNHRNPSTMVPASLRAYLLISLLTLCFLPAFSQQQAIEAEILARRKTNPSDAWALLFEANIHSLKHEYEPTLELLRKVQPDQLSADLQKRHRELTVESLTALIKSDFQNRDAEYAELQSFVTSEKANSILRLSWVDCHLPF